MHFVLNVLVVVVEKHTGPIFFENCLSLKQQVFEDALNLLDLSRLNVVHEKLKKMINDAIFFCSFMHHFAGIKQMMKFQNDWHNAA